MPSPLNPDTPDVREAHELRDYVAELVEESIVFDAAICHGINLGRKRALNRTQSDEHAGGGA